MEKVENLSHELEENMKEVLNSLLGVESKLIGILKKHNLDSRGFLEKFKDGDISIRIFTSGVGGYVALTYQGGQIPYTMSNLGCSFYIHNDINSPAHYIDSIEAIELSEKLPSYIEFFKETLQGLIIDSQKALHNTTQVLESIKEL